MANRKPVKILVHMDKDNENSFQVYRQPITNIKPDRLISLDMFLGYTEDPPRSIINVFDEIAEAESSGNKQLKARLKQHYLFYFTPCAVVHPVRNYQSIKEFTGLLVLDFDHIDNAPHFKSFLFDEYKSIIAAWLSPSKRGVKCLVKIPIVKTIVEFKEYYYGIAAEMEVFAGFDPSGQNAVLPLFQSWDPDLLSRDNFDIWTNKGGKRSDFDLAPARHALKIDVTDKDKQIIAKIINTGFDHIIDYGHPMLRSLCITIGGYIASGYIAEQEALQMINYEIETHPYLTKGIAGYKKTAQWAIKIGQNKPLMLNNRRHG